MTVIKTYEEFLPISSQNKAYYKQLKLGDTDSEWKQIGQGCVGKIFANDYDKDVVIKKIDLCLHGPNSRHCKLATLNRIVYMFPKQINQKTHWLVQCPDFLIEQIISEYHRIFQDQKQKITYCKGDEDEIPDPRIFNVEKYSTIIQNNFSNNSLLNNIVRNYTNSNFNKKTLINKVIYKENQKMNSGGGWHRDNHDKQFKTIMYLSDVTENNGCFQFITNSSKKHIGYPEPRTANYNTRYTDNTIKDILEKYKNCKIHDIVGKKGTIILVDTTYIHRGKVIEEGERYAMTEYYF